MTFGQLMEALRRSRHAPLLWGGAALLALGLLVQLVYRPLTARIGAQRMALRELRVKVADAQALAQQAPQHQAALERARVRYQALERRLGDGQGIARALETLSAQAKERRLEFVGVQPSAGEGEQPVVMVGPALRLRELPLTVQLTGRYRQLGEFLGELPQAPFLAVVRRLTLSRPRADTPKVLAELLLSVYPAESALSP